MPKNDYKNLSYWRSQTRAKEFVAKIPQQSDESVERVQDTAFEGLMPASDSSPCRLTTQRLALHKINSTCLEKHLVIILSQIYLFFRDFSWVRYKNGIYLTGLVLIAILCSCMLVYWEESGGQKTGENSELTRFLNKLGMGHYTRAFWSAGYSHIEDVLWASDEHLKIEVGIQFGAHRRRIKAKAIEFFERKNQFFYNIKFLFATGFIFSVGSFFSILIFIFTNQTARERAKVFFTTLAFLAYHRYCIWCQMWELLVTPVPVPNAQNIQFSNRETEQNQDDNQQQQQQQFFEQNSNHPIAQNGYPMHAPSQNLDGMEFLSLGFEKQGQQQEQFFDDNYWQNGNSTVGNSEDGSVRRVKRKKRGFKRFFRKNTV